MNSSMLTILPAGSFADVTKGALDSNDIDEMYVDISGGEGLDNLIDETMFKTFTAKIETWIRNAMIHGCMLMHPGMPTSQKDARGVRAKEEARKATSLLLRLTCILTLFLTASNLFSS